MCRSPKTSLVIFGAPRGYHLKLLILDGLDLAVENAPVSYNDRMPCTTVTSCSEN
jgi:hypothetical protein